MQNQSKKRIRRERSRSRTRRDSPSHAGIPTEEERAQYHALNHPFDDAPPPSFEECDPMQQKWIIVHRTLYPNCATNGTQKCGCATMEFVSEPRKINTSVPIKFSHADISQTGEREVKVTNSSSTAASRARVRAEARSRARMERAKARSPSVTRRLPHTQQQNPDEKVSMSQEDILSDSDSVNVNLRQRDTNDPFIAVTNTTSDMQASDQNSTSTPEQVNKIASQQSAVTEVHARESSRLPGDNTKMVNNSKEGAFQTLWTLDYGERVIRFLLLYHAELAKFWYDEKGAGPVRRFLRPDQPAKHVLPSRRVIMFMVLGFLLSAVGVWFTDDEYFVGPNQVGSPWDYPVHIAFQDVGCTIPGMRRPALQGITGEIVPGRLTAILGQSGSGKTTFTHALLGREQQSCQPGWGDVFLNGQRRSLEAYLDRVGFVPQDDVLYPELTVEETLIFSANWRLPRTVGRGEKLRLLEDTLDTLDLTSIRYQRIGDVQRRGISGGEKKRVSIGMELIASPSVLVMDEPTSGLDSAGAYRLVKTLRAIANKGVSVVTVLHQPSARVFDQIQDLILLQNGKGVYSGPREGVMSFLHALHYWVPGYSDTYNDTSTVRLDGNASSTATFEDNSYDVTQASPAEFLLDVLAGLEQPHNRTYDLPKEWRNTMAFQEQWISIRKKLDRFQRDLYESSADGSAVQNLPYPIRPKPGFKKQFQLWLVLLFKINWRRGIGLEMAVVASLALVVAFVRSYNTHWNRRPLANFFVSVAIGLVGMLGAVFNDDIGPVRRAANSGIILGAHEFGSLFHAFVKARLSCDLFAFAFFSFLYLRTGVFCTSPFSWSKYLEWTHMVHLNYVNAYVLGTVICVLVDHDPPSAYVIAVATLIAVHVFAFFTPNRNQIDRDSMIFGQINTAPLVHFLCAASYVRYWMEAIVLWEPEGDDRVGRNYALRHYGYRERHKSMCCNLMFVVASIGHVVRFTLFSIRNTNLFNSLYDTPLFVTFIVKVFAAHVAALILGLASHEFPTFKAAWSEVAARESINRNARKTSTNATSLSNGASIGNTPLGEDECHRTEASSNIENS